MQTEAGDAWRGRFLVWAVGNLSATKRPDLPGLEEFAGTVLHTAQWPHEPVDIMLDEDANDTAADFVRDKIAAAVDDPETRELLTPRDHPFGAKRPVVDDGCFATFNRDHVSLVDIRSDPLARATPEGIELQSGSTLASRSRRQRSSE